MERRSSFKECPKCGLRNKPSAVQCDFCGQNLTSSDDWQLHVKDLESLNKMELRTPVDDRTSRRIESTIIRKDLSQYKGVEIKEAGDLERALHDLDKTPFKIEIEVEEIKVKPLWTPGPEVETNPAGVEMEAPPGTKPAEPSVTESSIAPSSSDDGAPAEERVDAAPEVEKTIEPFTTIVEAEVAKPEPNLEETEEEPTTVGVDVEVVPSQPALEPPFVEEVVVDEPTVTLSSNPSQQTIRLRPVEETPEEGVVTSTHRHLLAEGMVAVAILVLGIVLYLVVVALVAVSVLDTVGGLAGGAVASVMIIYGAAVIHPSLKRKDLGVVFICPRCHETVQKEGESCPSCGAKFSPED